MKRIIPVLVVIVSFLCFSVVGFAQTYDWDVSDNAENSAYPGGSWSDGSNGGSGFLGWSFNSSGSGGRYIGSTALDATSFGIYSFDGGSYSALRPFEKSLKSGDTFTVNIAHTATINGEIGLTLLDGSQGVITLKFVGGNSAWTFNDGRNDFGISQSYIANTSLTFTFTYNGGSSYSFTFGNASGNNYTATSDISGIDGVNFYNNNQGNGENFGFDNLAISGSASSSSDVPTNSDVTISGNVELGVDETLTLNDLVVDAGNSFTIKSSALGTGSLVTNGSVTGNIIAERYVAGYTTNTDGWHHISSPVATFAIAGSDFVPGANDDFFSWSEADAYWYNYQQNEGPDNMNEGEGYLVAYETTATKTFTGTVNNDNKTFNDLSYTANDFQGWHLLGNPFPCALKWDATSWNRMNVDAVAKIWNEGNASYDDLNQNEIIPAMNGFMVHVNNSTNSITIPTADRTHSATGWLKADEINTLKLTVFDLEGNTAQQSVLKFNQNATEAYDGEYDSYYLSGYAPQFYSMINEKAVSTNTLPELFEELEVPFYFVKNSSSSYRLEIEGIESLETSSPVYLTDNKTGQTVNFNEVDSYEFQAEEGDAPARFMLHFKSTGIDDLPNIHAPSVHVSGNQLNILGSENEINTVRIVDITGRILLYKSGFHNQEISLPLRLETGIYIVEVVTQSGKFANKVYIK